MLDKYFKYIVLALLIIIVAQRFFSLPEGVNEEAEIYKAYIYNLREARIRKDSVINNLQNENKNFKAAFDSITNSAIIDTATASQLNGFFSKYIEERQRQGGAKRRGR